MKKEYPLIKMFAGYSVLLVGLIFTIKYAFKHLFPRQKQEEAIKAIAKENNLSDEQATDYKNIANDLTVAFKTEYAWYDPTGWWFNDIKLAIETLKKIRNKWEFEIISNYYTELTTKPLQDKRTLRSDIIRNLSDSEKAQLPSFILQ